MRIRVVDVLDLLETGLGFDQILEELPDLEREDITAAIRYAKQGIRNIWEKHSHSSPMARTSWKFSEARFVRRLGF
jgi:hypothetical protein